MHFPARPRAAVAVVLAAVALFHHRAVRALQRDREGSITINSSVYWANKSGDPSLPGRRGTVAAYPEKIYSSRGGTAGCFGVDPKYVNNVTGGPENCTVKRGPTTAQMGRINSKIAEGEEGEVEGITLRASSRNSSDFGRLRFLEIPKGDGPRIHELRLQDEFLLFEAFSDLMGYLQPKEFPAELVRGLVRGQLPVHLAVFQILKIDMIMVIWAIVWAILTLSLPFGIGATLCCPNDIRRLEEDSSLGTTDSERKTEKCLGVLLHILLFLLMAPIVLILAANEQLSRSVSKLPTATEIIYDDINTFLRNTHMQISFVVTSSTDIAIEGMKKDLEDVESLLGRPYQELLSSETGIDVALLALGDLKSETARVTFLVSELLSDCTSAKIAAAMAQDELNDISRQLTVIKQQCGSKDRPLCYTMQYAGFDISFTTENITNDVKIRQLEKLGADPVFNGSIETAQKSFTELPRRSASDASALVTDTKAILIKRRTDVYKSTHAVDVLARSLSESLRIGEELSKEHIRDSADWDLWRWLSVLGIASVLSLVWGLLLCGAPCGCGITSRTIALLITGLSLACFCGIVVWVLGSVSLLLGGHGKGLVCNPLYDYPKFQTLTSLFDGNGVFYDKGGILAGFNERKHTLRLAEVLRHCQHDHPAYVTFQLQHHMNVSRILNYKEWEDLRTLFFNFTNVGGRNVEILAPSLQLSLQTLSSASDLNLTAYRLLASSAITKRDLGSFADQLNTVARQINDAVTARKFDNLAFSVRKILGNELTNLLEDKNKILYKLTKLEVLLPNLRVCVERSLKHMKEVQYFLDSQGWSITQKARKHYITRLESYLDELYKHVELKVTREIGNCHTLWEIFHSARFYVCKLMIDPLNGIAFSSFFIILVFLAVGPLVIKLVDYYKESNDDVLTSITHRRFRNGLMIEDEAIWSTPTSQTPELIITGTTPPPIPPERPATATAWTTPGSRSIQDFPSTSRVRSPKGKMSMLSSTFAKAKNLTQVSVSRPRSPRRGRKNHESLRLVEPITWKSGSTTPRSWI